MCATTEVKTKPDTNEKEVISLYKTCYEDAVAKNLPEWYLEYVYYNGQADFSTLTRLAKYNNKSIIDLLLQYFGWQYTENNLSLLRGEGGNIYQTDKTFQDLWNRVFVNCIFIRRI